MIVLSFLTFVFMFVWMIGSVVGAIIGCAMGDGNLEGFGLFCGCVLSLVCWWQVMVWGKPWFDLCVAAWL